MRYQALLLALIIIGGAYTLHAEKGEGIVSYTGENAKNTRADTAREPVWEMSCESSLAALTSQSALVKNMATEEILFEKNAGAQWPIASLTKLMTGIVAKEKIPEQKNIVVGVTAIRAPSGEVFKEGNTVTRDQSIEGMIVHSNNGLAIALAETYGEETFLEAMEQKADALKMFHTYFKDSTGLSRDNKSTARDLLKLIEYIITEQEDILSVSRQKTAEIIELGTGERIVLPNKNPAAEEPGFMGGKTGYIKVANRNAINIFRVRNEPVVTILLGADDAWYETKVLLRCVP